MDPISQSTLIRHALSEDKRCIGFLIGAGCPLSIRIPGDGGASEPLIPDIAGITVRVTKLMEDAQRKQYELVLSQLKADEIENPNIEDILGHVRKLRAAAGTEGARNLSPQELVALDETISKMIASTVNQELPVGDTPYRALAIWASSIPRDKCVEFFTTNYDLLLEQALETDRVPYFDGFIGTRRSFFDPFAIEADSLPARWAKLWKLHGSINWKESNGQVARLAVSEVETPNMIHPSHLKYDENRRMPFLAMMDRLRSFFASPSPVLVTCGFSFGDQHLNEALDQGLRGNPTAHTFALMYDKLDCYPSAIDLASSRRNLSLLARDGGVVGTRRYEWQADGVESVSSPPIAAESTQAEQTVGAPLAEAGADGSTLSHSDSASSSPAAPPSNPGVAATEFQLGDFAKFGEFISEIVGDVRL